MSKGSTKKSTTMAEVDKSSKKDDAVVNYKPLPLSQRKIDLIWGLWYIIFAFTVLFTDLHNFTAAIRGITVQELEVELSNEPNRIWPPKLLTYIYYRWARTLDPLLYFNPVWWQCIEWVNLCCLMPFSLFAIFGFPLGWKSIRIPAIVVSSFTAYSLILCVGSTIYNDKPSEDPIMFMAIYLPYFFMPLLVILRLWQDNPFGTKLHGFVNAVEWIGTTAILAIFGSYALKWFVLCEPGMLGEQVYDMLIKAGIMNLPGGSVCPTA